MAEQDADIDRLIRLAEGGDESAQQQLFVRHRDRLRRMVASRLNDKLAARFDPSDVVQDALAIASQKLPQYLKDRPVPFYPWLRQIAWERLVDLHRRHLQAKARTVSREQPLALSDTSALQLADRLVAKGSTPSQGLLRNELRTRLRSGLDQMQPEDREILLMRHVEQLRVDEIADILKLTSAATKSPLRRSLERLQHVLGENSSEQR